MLSLVMADNQNGSGGLSLLIMFALPLLLVAYMFWSQKRRLRQVEQVQSTLRVGDEVMTTSGLFGTLRAIDGEVAHIEAAPRLVLRFDRRAVMPVEPAATAATGAAATGAAAAEPAATGPVATDEPAPIERPATTGATTGTTTATTTPSAATGDSTTEHPSAAPTEDVK